MIYWIKINLVQLRRYSEPYPQNMRRIKKKKSSKQRSRMQNWPSSICNINKEKLLLDVYMLYEEQLRTILVIYGISALFIGKISTFIWIYCYIQENMLCNIVFPLNTVNEKKLTANLVFLTFRISKLDSSSGSRCPHQGFIQQYIMI